MVARSARNIQLQFDPTLDLLATGKRLSEGMSAAVAIEESVWLTHDETVWVERLDAERTKAGSLRYANHRRFDLRDFVTLPAAGEDSARKAPPEADLEGISYCEGYLWVVGSHSALRDGAKGRTASDAIAALAKVRRSGNRFLLARIPVERSGAGPVLMRRSRTEDGRLLNAARLPGGRKNDALTRALRDDPHLGPFLSIPSKDNGFDIEGLAAAPGGRLFLGLRGPVLDGWACVLEVNVATHLRRNHELVLRKIARHSTSTRTDALYRKHFLDLEGAGIRDLCLAGRDLLVLTGPPMRGKGTAQVRQWHDALASKGERMLNEEQLPTLLELPYREKKDHAEGIAVIGRKEHRIWLMVIYDSAGKGRRVAPAGTMATVHELSLSSRRKRRAS
jgi:Protein of unknown function (DUF3616)